MNGDPVVTIRGNVTADPEIRYTTNGTPVASVTIAHTPKIKRGDQWEDGTALFLRCEAWREQAEHMSQSLTKGARVVATGFLRQDEWKDKESGEKRTAMKLVIEEIGASLRFADVKIHKAQRQAGPAPVDPWSGDSATESERPAATADGFSQDPPF